MPTTATAKLGVSLKLENGNVIELHEGDIVNDLVYRNSGIENTISGAIRVIDANTRSNSSLPDDCPPEPYAHRYITVPSMVIDSSDVYDADLKRVSIASILSIGSVVENGGAITVGVGGQYKALSEIIASADAGSVINLQDGEFTESLDITKSLKIVGSANTVISGKLNIVGDTSENAEPVKVELSGVKLSGDAIISASNAQEVIMDGCIFEGHNLTAKTMPVAVTTENPMKLVIENCTFGDQNNFSYNLIDVYGKLANGSSISNNTFSNASCSHNQISLYGVEDGAVVNINNNKCARSANLVRIGFKGEPNCTVNMIGNSYDATDDNDEWAGLFLVQPYGTQTTSFAKTTINVEKTTMSNPGGQLCYLYAGTNDTQFTDDNKPTIIVDGVVIDPIVR